MANTRSHLTLAQTTEPISGVGVHSGKEGTVTIHPATEPGLVMQKNGNTLTLEPKVVSNTRNATTVSGNGVQVSTVEHLLAALGAFGITSAIIEVDGAELPILDGTSQPWCQALQAVGIAELDATYHPLNLAELEIDWAALDCTVVPTENLILTVEQQFGHPLLQNHNTFSAPVDAITFTNTIANARTFAWEQDIEQLRAAGLIQGGSLDCAVVFSTDDVINDGGLRYPDEPLRHKWLDLLGDLQLLGQPLVGHLTVRNPSHTRNQAIVQAIYRTLSA